jgi:hypothetical protein
MIICPQGFPGGVNSYRCGLSGAHVRTPGQIIHVPLKGTALGGFQNSESDFTGIAGGADPFGFHKKFKITDVGSGFRKYFNFVLGIGFDVHIYGTFQATTCYAEIFEEDFPVNDPVYPSLGKGLIPEVFSIISHNIFSLIDIVSSTMYNMSPAFLYYFTLRSVHGSQTHPGRTYCRIV